MFQAFYFLALSFVLETSPLPAQEVCRVHLNKMRFDDNVSCFQFVNEDPSELDQLKFIPLSEDGAYFVSFGGEVRERYQFTSNPAFGEGPQDEHGLFLQRYVLHADLHLGQGIRIFSQIYSALAVGQKGGPSPVDENQLEFQNAFIDFRALTTRLSELTLRVGLQELQFGSGRLVDVREGPNVRRTFYAVRTFLELPDWRIDATIARPRLIQPGIFDDEVNDQQELWGIYAAGNGQLFSHGNADFYYLGYRNRNATFANQETASEKRQSIGIRLWGQEENWDWNLEGVYQFGTFGEGVIQAWTLASETGYSLSDQPWYPRIALSANISSGDKSPEDVKLGTFNPLFPRGNYFSEAAVLGPRNFFNFHPFVTVSPAENWSITTDVDFFWRLESEDGLYSPSGGLVREPGGSNAHYVGTSLSLSLDWVMARNLALTFIYSHFFAGTFIKETGADKDIDYMEITLGFRF